MTNPISPEQREEISEINGQWYVNGNLANTDEVIVALRSSEQAWRKQAEHWIKATKHWQGRFDTTVDSLIKKQEQLNQAIEVLVKADEALKNLYSLIEFSKSLNQADKEIINSEITDVGENLIGQFVSSLSQGTEESNG